MNATSTKVMLLSVATGGGVRKVQRDLANGLTDRGYDVCVVTLCLGAPYLDQLHQDVRLIGINTRNPFSFIKMLVQTLRKECPDIVIASQDQTIIPMAVLRLVKVWRGPTVGVVHNNPIVHKRARSPLARLMPYFARFAYSSLNWTVTVSKGLREKLLAENVLKPKSSSSIYNGIEPVVAEGETPADIPKKFILGVGNLNAQKDFATLIRAFSLISSTYSGDLVILGEGPYRERLQKQIEALDLAERVFLQGFRNPTHYYNNADLFAVSSEWEGFSLVLAEALSMGCPVVATNCDFGPPEILDYGAIGPLVPVGDASSLADAIMSLIASPPDRRALFARAEHFSLPRCVENYARLIETLTQE